MTSLDLQAEHFAVLPLRLETITIGGPKGTVDQNSWLNQNNFNNQVGGDCLKADCNQFNWQANFAHVDQLREGGGATLKDVIEDHSKLYQSLPFTY